jgi:hypothetical protein
MKIPVQVRIITLVCLLALPSSTTLAQPGAASGVDGATAQADAAESVPAVEEAEDFVPLHDVYLGGEGYFEESGTCDCEECRAGGHGHAADWEPLAAGLAPYSGLWARADYLLWSMRGSELPPLVTTSPLGTAPANTGVLGLGTTEVLFGGRQDNGFRSGGRFTLGFANDPRRGIGWEASYMGLERDATTLSLNSGLVPNLARPVFDTLPQAEAALLVAHSGFLNGAIDIDTSTRLQAFDLVRRMRWCVTPWHTWDLLLGYKHARLDDVLRMRQESQYFVAQGPILAGTSLLVDDSFDTKNSFHGVLLGIHRRHQVQAWQISYDAKISLGSTTSEAILAGRTVTSVPGAGSARFQGGLLAQASNIGTFRESRFSALPEFDFRVSRYLSDGLSLDAGYSLVYWSNVARVGDIISRQVSQLPPEPVSGSGDPKFQWRSSGFLAHGFQFGMTYRF